MEWISGSSIVGQILIIQHTVGRYAISVISLDIFKAKRTSNQYC